MKCPGCGKATAAPVDSVAESKIMDAPSRDTHHFRDMAAVLRRDDPAPPKSRTALGRFGAKKWLAAARGEGRRPVSRDEQLEAIRTLGESRDPAAKDALVKLAATSSESLKVREAAIAALGELGDKRATADLVELLDSTESEFRQAAVTALGRLGDRRAVRPLLHFAVQHPHSKYLAYDALLKLDQEAVTDLLDALNHSDPSLVLEAVVILGRMKSPRAVPALIQVVETRPSVIRAHAIESLAQIGDRRAVSTLLPLLADANLGVRLNAAAALARIPDKQAIEPLCRTLRDEDDDVRVHALGALAAIGDGRAAAAILDCLNHPSAEVQVAAAEALGQCGDARSVPPLIERLSSSDEPIRLRAISALRRLKDPRAVAALVPMLGDSSDVVRQRVVDTLGQIGDAEIAAPLEQRLKRDRSELVRAAAAKALGDLGDPGAIDALVEALRDEFPIRCRAVVSLGVLKDDAALPAIAALLRDPAPEIRLHAAGALAEIAPPHAKALLEPLIEDSQPMVRRGVARAFEKLGDPRAAELLANADRPTLSRSVRQTKKQLREAVAFLAPSWIVGLWPSSSRGRMAVGAAAALALVATVVATAGLPALMPATSAKHVPRGKVQSVAFSTDGKTIAVGRTQGLIELWNVASKSIEKTTQADLIAPVCAAGESGRFLLPVGSTPLLWNASREAKPGSSLSAHRKPLTALTTTADGKFAATMDADRVVYAWDLASGQAGAAIQLPPNIVVGTLAMLPDGKRIVTADQEKNVVVWDLTAAQPVGRLPRQKAPVARLAVSPDGGTLAVGGLNQLTCWSLQTMKELPMPAVTGSVSLVTFAPQGTRLAYVVGSTVLLAAPGDATAKTILIDEIDSIESISFSPDEKRIAAGSSESTRLIVCDVESGDVTHRLDVKP